jgi:hypothetical protein
MPAREFIQYEAGDGIATLWLNRLEVKNGVSSMRPRGT